MFEGLGAAGEQAGSRARGVVITAGVDSGAATVTMRATSVWSDRQGQPQPPPQCYEHAVGRQSGASLARMADKLVCPTYALKSAPKGPFPARPKARPIMSNSVVLMDLKYHKHNLRRRSCTSPQKCHVSRCSHLALPGDFPFNGESIAQGCRLPHMLIQQLRKRKLVSQTQGHM